MTWLVALAFPASWLGCAWLIQRPGRVLDYPGDRSLHALPTPRLGGVAIALGMLPASTWIFMEASSDFRLLLAGWLAVFGISLLDDVRSLPFWIRLPVHVGAGLCVVLSPAYPPDMWLIGLGLFWIVWGTNLFNFMDGMDGLAGSMAGIGGAALAGGLALVGSWPLAFLSLAASSAATGFLYFNWPPARIFMGDSGSASLGFLFSAIAVGQVAAGRIEAWFPLLVFLPFIADATLTLLRRALQRKPVWRAHREHLYQRLVLSGWPTRRVLLLSMTLIAVCAATALAALVLPDIDGGVVLVCASLITLAGYSGMMAVRR